MPSGLIKIFGKSSRWEGYKRRIIFIQKDYVNPSENWHNYKGETQWDSNKEEIQSESQEITFILECLSAARPSSMSERRNELWWVKKMAEI